VRTGPNSSQLNCRPPEYPAIALAAHVFGTVDLTVNLSKDGTIDSAEALAGLPMLKQPAMESAKQAQFECRNCTSAVTPFHIALRFELGKTLYCDDPRDSSYPRVTQSNDIFVIAAQPIGTCDLSGEVTRTRNRSAKCLYLWKCGWR
jgi:hypothetical protein